MNLQKKAFITIGGILTLIISINAIVMTLVASTKYKQAILSKDAAIGEGMHRDLTKILNLGVSLESLEGMNEKLNDLLSRDRSLGYAMIMDSAGKILFHTDQSSIGKALKDDASLKIVSSKETITQTIDGFYDISFPLLNPDGKIAGAFRLGVLSKAINAQLYALSMWALGVSAGCFFLLAPWLVYFAISKFITRPITDMEKAADRIAAGDLTYEIDIRGKDEVASLGKAINRMSFNLKDIISKIVKITNIISTVTANIGASSKNILSATDVQKKAIEETASAVEEVDKSIANVSTSADSLSKSANDSSSSISELSTAIERVAESAKDFSDTTHNTTASIEEMVANIKEIAESVEKLFATSSEIVSSIEEVNDTTKNIAQSAHESVILAEKVMNNASQKGLASAEAATQGMETIKSNVISVSDVINSLGKRSNEIGKILTVIDNVADQTNLLALNAAILAAHAGEHGKGFAIVANEIKDLAERTSKSTMEISSLIKSVQEEAQSSIRMATEGVQTVQHGIKVVRDVHSALTEILDSSKVSTEMARAIQKSTAEESAIIKHITSSVEAMNTQIENISRAIKEQNKGSSLIIEATEKVNEVSNHLKTAISEQRDGSRHISAATEDVAREASLIADSTGKQKEKSMDIVDSMEKIRNTTGSLIASSNEMYEAINSLQQEALNLLSELQKFKV